MSFVPNFSPGAPSRKDKKPKKKAVKKKAAEKLESLERASNSSASSASAVTASRPRSASVGSRGAFELSGEQQLKRSVVGDDARIKQLEESVAEVQRAVQQLVAATAEEKNKKTKKKKERSEWQDAAKDASSFDDGNELSAERDDASQGSASAEGDEPVLASDGQARGVGSGDSSVTVIHAARAKNISGEKSSLPGPVSDGPAATPLSPRSKVPTAGGELSKSPSKSSLLGSTDGGGEGSRYSGLTKRVEAARSQAKSDTGKARALAAVLGNQPLERSVPLVDKPSAKGIKGDGHHEVVYLRDAIKSQNAISDALMAALLLAQGDVIDQACFESIMQLVADAADISGLLATAHDARAFKVSLLAKTAEPDKQKLAALVDRRLRGELTDGVILEERQLAKSLASHKKMEEALGTARSSSSSSSGSGGGGGAGGSGSVSGRGGRSGGSQARVFNTPQRPFVQYGWQPRGGLGGRRGGRGGFGLRRASAQDTS